MNTGIWWAFDYSFIVAFLYLSFLMFGFVSWVYGEIKTLLIYRKIESKKFILNLVPLVWLFLVPTAITEAPCRTLSELPRGKTGKLKPGILRIAKSLF